ncbi:hypothetical protein E1B28_006764 [Marasmius oreades]|uniref:Uncharacterized protein n=1 Tax=Marasmius oreades TaxID=181124 RepID=A0A9P8AB41_9AGAR|nr:uncharacterized protein E1B28_006764 [Marasmius oreades]KAG7096088.1 hypothetical protein E1B28_006764 [Marasmius oreades]
MIMSPSMPLAQPAVPYPQAPPYASTVTYPAPYVHSTSRASSPSNHSRASDGLPYRGMGSPSTVNSEFEVERVSKANRRRSVPVTTTEDDIAYRESVSRLLIASTRVSTISGYIPLDPSHLILFFRTKSGITHSLDFPIDVDYNTPPALDVLIASCRPHQTSDSNDYSDTESLFYPPNLPLTTSLELANHPILDAVRGALFPLLPQGHYLTVVRDKLEAVVNGGRMGTQSRMLRNDGRVATICVTLPVRFRGGALLVRDAEGHEEKFYGRGGKSGDIEWVAFSADCEYEVELVQKGTKVTLCYGVYLKTFGASGVTDPLINPSDVFLDLVSPVLNYSRGRCVGFYVGCEYAVNPAEMVADTLVPMLKGGDSLLYHALKLYKLSPEIRWTAGGYIWPRDVPVEIINPPLSTQSSPTSRLAGMSLQGAPPPVRGPFGVYSEHEGPEDSLRNRVIHSGAISLAEADIMILTDWNTPSPLVGKERVPFVNGGEMEKLVVNALIVIFVP